MGAIFQVKTRLIFTVSIFLSVVAAKAAGDPAADGAAVLKAMKVAQTSQHMNLSGSLRTGPVTVPLQLIIDGSVIKYEFKDPAVTLVLRLGDKGSQLQEVTRSGTEKITPARFDAKVRGSDISYEDLSMRFLYWPQVALVGEDTKLLRRCWKVQVEPDGVDSQYSKVLLWVDEGSQALLEADAFDKSGKLARKFVVRSVQKSKVDGVYILKQMRIEAPGAKEDKLSYLEISGEEK